MICSAGVRQNLEATGPMATNMMRYILSIILCSWASCACAFPPGFIGAATGGGKNLCSMPDTFSDDSSSCYTSISGSLVITGGVAGFIGNPVFIRHNTPTGSNDHCVEGKLIAGPNSSNASLIGLRNDGTNGYYSTLAYNSLGFNRHSGSVITGITGWTLVPTLTDGAAYRTKVCVVGSTFTAWIDRNNDGDYDDEYEALGNKTDATYSTGQYVTLGQRRVSGTFTVDDFRGGVAW